MRKNTINPRKTNQQYDLYNTHVHWFRGLAVLLKISHEIQQCLCTYIIHCRRILKYSANTHVAFRLVLDSASSLVAHITRKSEHMMNKLIWKLKKCKHYILWYRYLVRVPINISVPSHVPVDVHSQTYTTLTMLYCILTQMISNTGPTNPYRDPLSVDNQHLQYTLYCNYRS